MEDKFEREIEDILSRLDRFPRHGRTYRARRAFSAAASSLHQGITGRLARLTLSQTMFTAIILVCVGYFFRTALPGIWYYIIVAGLILFFASFFASFLGRQRAAGGGQIYWRGRPASAYSASSISFAERLRDWWRRHQRRRL
jgi:hypothetical protein